MSWSLVLLALLAGVSLADGAPMKILSAPNLLRVGTPENVFVECQECSGNAISVDVSVWNHPTGTHRLASTTVPLNSQNKFQGFGQITLPPEFFSADPKAKQYVYLRARFDGQQLEKVVLVTFQSGYIFIQTDKTLYTPGSTVLFRMFALTPQMKPMESAGGLGNFITIDIETPDGIILPQSPKELKSGIHSGNYLLPQLVSPGEWKVVAKFQKNPLQRYVASFEVREYVLPTLEVTLTPVVPFFQVDSMEFTVNIKARYLFGEAVKGTAYVVFGVITNNKRTSFAGSLQRVRIQRGVGEVTLQQSHITAAYKDIRSHITASHKNIGSLDGSYMFVSVSVLTDSGSEMVDTELSDIKIVSSPYSIEFIKTPKYFKPGMTFDLTVEVTNPDKTPAANVPLVVNPGNVVGISEGNGLANLKIKTSSGVNSYQITAKTTVPTLSPNQQAEAEYTIHPYITTTSRYIHIGVESTNLGVGNNLRISLYLKPEPTSPKDLTYLILSKGQLVKYGREKIQSQSLLPLNIQVNKEMLPSFRIVVYYHPDDTEVVSDSVWVDVKDSCMGSLTLEPVDPAPSYFPGRTFDLKVTGDPGAKVGLVAVDKGVYVLNNKFRLTQKKIWDEVEKHDTGCTPGGGKNSMGVFYDAGLVLQTSTGSGTPYRQELQCPETPKPRSKCAVTIMEVSSTLVGKYENNALQTACCLDGMRETPLSYDCNRRSKYIVDGKACVDAFLDCCNQMQSSLSEQKKTTYKLARTDAKGVYIDSRNIDVRSNFKESFLWNDYTLPACPTQLPHCSTTSLTRSVGLQDSITTWVFTGISLSNNNGICIGKSLEIIARKDFFIDLKLPYSAVRHEQIEIRAVLHNYTPSKVKVRVELVENPQICSLAYKRKKHHKEVDIGPRRSRSVPFVIIPMEIGELDITVYAAVKETSIVDGIKKQLRVVSQGVLISDPKIIPLDPVKKGKDGVQTVVFNSKIAKKDLIPNSPSSVLISVTGREDIEDMVENAISGRALGTLIRHPTGCGEQNMIIMTLPVIATKYLDATEQWEAVGLHRREDALRHITTGYTTQLKYGHPDGSYSAWEGRKKSSWLTAYVLKVFSMSYNLAKIQPEKLCESVRYLTLHSQLPDGMFKEIGDVYQKEMIGDIQGLESDVSMTAFCLIAMQESKPICSQIITSLTDTIEKSVQYLENRLPSLTNPYAVALASYALANSDKLNREILFKFISPELSHWPVPRGEIYTIEATAYALLALVRAKAFQDAKPIVRWLSTKQDALGGWGSTQATIMVYQAVAEYWSNAREPEYNLELEILSEGKSKPLNYTINRQNHFATRTSKVNDIFHNISLTAKGTGEATVKMVSLYYAFPSNQESDCEKFEMSVTLIPEKENSDDVYLLRINVLYKDKSHDSTMAILDIGLLTGYTPDFEDLKSLSDGHDRVIAHFEMNQLLSERGSLIIYLDKVSHTLADEISFKIKKSFNSALLQPAAVSIYEYYNQTKCMKFYHPMRENGTLQKLCKTDACRCAEESCTMQRKGNIENTERIDKICETAQIEFAYKVRLEEIHRKGLTDINIMRILDVIKRVSIDAAPDGLQRPFLSYLHCKDALNLKKGGMYLIMGSSQIVERNEVQQTYDYAFGEKTWVEYWPTEQECLGQTFRPTCLSLQKFLRITAEFPCDV